MVAKFSHGVNFWVRCASGNVYYVDSTHVIVFAKCQWLGDGKIDIHRLVYVSRFSNEPGEKIWKIISAKILDVLFGGSWYQPFWFSQS